MANAQETESAHALFAQCSFVIVRSATLTQQDADKALHAIQLHGGEGTIDEYPDHLSNLDGITHIISTTADFPDYHAALDAMTPVVKPQWIENSLAKNRLAHTRQFSPDQRYFMSDVVICCADIPEGDADAISGGTLAMGGNYTTKITSMVTHIVALSLENDLCELALKRKLDVKIVLPHWFDDCLKLGRKIDEQPYMLPNPEWVGDLNQNPPHAGNTCKGVSGATDPHPAEKTPMTGRREPIKVFKNKTFMFGDDLGVGEHLLGILHGLIMGSGGYLTDNVSKANYYICKYREGADYKKASRARKHVGNLAWLYYMIMHDEWTSPLRRLLHYPVARNGLPGFENLEISLSNYSGEARTYLEHLINATGAVCTKTLRQANTHLITAHNLSEKCAAAKDWNIQMVNHMWLEESYAQWQKQSVTNPRYTHFPKRTNLTEVVGQTPIDRGVIDRVFLNDSSATDADTAPSKPTAAQKKAAKEAVPTSSPAPAKGRPSRAAQAKAQDGNTNSDAETHQTPTANRHASLDKENITPMTTRSSRKSKDAAVAKLHDLTPDIALYEKEKKRVGGVTHGGRRKTEEKPVRTSLKRSAEPTETEDSNLTQTKKQKRGSSSTSIHLLISGYKRWVGKPKEEDADLKRLRDLGIVVVNEPSKATHLAVPHIVRTSKFVVALAYSPIIISTDFVDACLQQNEHLDPDDFELQDPENEGKLGVTLKVSLERAKKNRRQLLQDRSIFCTEKIHGGFETFQAIVEANGGQCMTWRGRHTIIPSTRASSEVNTDNESANGSEVYLLSGDSKEEKRVWSRFVKMAEASRRVPRIVKSEWLLDSAMSQQIQDTAAFEFDSES